MSFSLRSLFLAFVVVAASLGAFGPWGLLVGVFVVSCVAYFAVTRDGVSGCIAAGVIAVLILSNLCTLQLDGGEGSRCARCFTKLSLIAVALRQYHDDYGSFPPAYVPGPDGKPWHSWRVLLLPYYYDPSIYAAYNFNEPWDGPSNSKLAVRIGDAYQCPATNGGAGDVSTSYLAVVGPGTAWPGAKPRRLDEISDGPANTILLVETAGLDIPWMEPQDLNFNQVAAMKEADPRIVGSMPHRHESQLLCVTSGGAFNVAMADSNVEMFRYGVGGEELAPLLTARGGEDADLRVCLNKNEGRVDWPRACSFLLLVIAIRLLWRSASSNPAAKTAGTETEDS